MLALSSNIIIVLGSRAKLSSFSARRSLPLGGALLPVSRSEARREGSTLLVSGDVQGKVPGLAGHWRGAPGLWAGEAGWRHLPHRPGRLGPHAVAAPCPGEGPALLPPCGFVCCLCTGCGWMSLDSRRVHLHQPVASRMAETECCGPPSVPGEAAEESRKEQEGASRRGI